MNKITLEIKRKDDTGEFVEMSENSLVSMNFWGFTPKYLEALESDFSLFLEENSIELKSEFFIPTVVNNIIESGKGAVKVLTSDAKWMGVTYAEDRPTVIEAITKLKMNNVYPKDLWR